MQFFFFFSPMAFVRRVIKRLTYLLTYLVMFWGIGHADANLRSHRLLLSLILFRRKCRPNGIVCGSVPLNVESL